MKNIFLITILNFTLITACNSTKLNYQDAYIQLTKKRCLGKCPVYDLFIYKNGKVVYNGIDNVEKEGKHEFNLSNQELKNLERMFADSEYKSLKDPVKSNIRDLPITLLKFKDKKIEFQGQKIPKKIKTIITALEALI